MDNAAGSFRSRAINVIIYTNRPRYAYTIDRYTHAIALPLIQTVIGFVSNACPSCGRRHTKFSGAMLFGAGCPLRSTEGELTVLKTRTLGTVSDFSLDLVLGRFHH